VRPCFESVRRWTDLGRHQVTLVNDGSDGHTTSVLHEWARTVDGVGVHDNGRNLGFVRSCNGAFQRSSADVVILLNSDTMVTPRWIEKILAALESDERIGVASPIASFSPHLSIRPLPGCDPLQMNALVETFSERARPDVTTPEGFCFIVTRRCLDTIGHFDPSFDDGYGEESDYSMRANHMGFRTVCVDDTYIYHRGRATFGIERRNAAYERNKRIFHSRWGDAYRAAFGEFQERDPLGALRHRLAELRPPDLEGSLR
jgi:GT2 family glycosyltransferase